MMVFFFLLHKQQSTAFSATLIWCRFEEEAQTVFPVLFHGLPWVRKAWYIREGRKGQVPHSGGEMDYGLGC